MGSMLIRRKRKQFSAKMVGAAKNVLSAVNSATNVPNAQLASNLKDGAKALGKISGQPKTILRGKSGTGLITRHYDKAAPRLKPTQPQPKQLELFPGSNGGPLTETNRRILAAGKKTRGPLIRAQYYRTANTTGKNEVTHIYTNGTKRTKYEPSYIPELI